MRAIAALFVILVTVGSAVAAPTVQNATSRVVVASVEQTSAQTAPARIPPPIVASGLPVPRWVSVKSGRVNVRRGPSLDQDIMWVYVRPGMPLEVIEEYDTWRKVRDLQGFVGWVKSGMLDGRRSAVIKGNVNALILSEAKADASVVAYAEPGVYVRIESCVGAWCKISARGYDGFVTRESLAGVYPNEVIK